jgi:hypothetical protein
LGVFFQAPVLAFSCKVSMVTWPRPGMSVSMTVLTTESAPEVVLGALFPCSCRLLGRSYTSSRFALYRRYAICDPGFCVRQHVIARFRKILGLPAPANVQLRAAPVAASVWQHCSACVSFRLLVGCCLHFQMVFARVFSLARRIPGYLVVCSAVSVFLFPRSSIICVAALLGLSSCAC